MRHIYSLSWAIGMMLFILTTVSAEERPVVSFGDMLPDVVLPVPGNAAGRDYLGLGEALLFTPSQVKCELLVIEVLNVHCLHCQVQAPAFNELFKMIEADPVTHGRIKMLGVAIGNLPGEVEKFRTTHPVPFPVVPNPDFVVHRAWGVNTTPYAAYVRQARSDGHPGFVVGTEHGLNTDYRRLFAQLQDYLVADIDALRRQGALAERRRTMTLPLYSEDDLQRIVRQAFINTGGQIELFKPLELRSGRRVYIASMRVGEERVRLFAEVASRQSVCDICHDLHFIYLFETSGRIVGFEPLQVTKFGNVLWNEAEVEHMRRRLIGQYLATARPFDPELDAVTSATISSAIIFDSIAQGEALLEELQTEGLL